jgi:zinc transport system substrate-binding protein
VSARLSAALCLCLILACASAARAEAPPRILAGTTLVADVLRDLCPQGAEIRVLIPGGACPGHFDLKPGDLALVQDARAVILHQWQKDMAAMRNLLRAAQNEALDADYLPEPENPMLPAGQLALTRAVQDALQRRFPAWSGHVRARAEARAARIQAVEQELLAAFAPLHAARPAALCSALQAPLARWAGLQVAMTYGRPEELTPGRVAALLEAGRAAGVSLVIDNIQSGVGAGRGLAEELGARQIDLTSFPGAQDGADTWEDALRANARLLLAAAGEPRP